MKALIVIDFINEIVDSNGKLAAKGYGEFVQRNATFTKVNEAIQKFRNNGDMVVFVRLAFHKSYMDQPKNSPIFGKANNFGVLENDSWSTEIHEDVSVNEDDLVIVKKRVNAFYGTNLSAVLNMNKIQDIYLAGVATDLAVEATARSGHDF